jgi:peptidoglycan/LPS O-acetylase OafA/YrhL
VIPLLTYLLPRRILLYIFLLGILTAPILRCASGGIHAFVFTPWRADSLLSGASLAVLVRWRPFMPAVQTRRILLLSVFLGLIAGAAGMSLRPVPFAALNQSWLARLYVVFVLIIFAGTEPRLGDLLRSPVLVWFGELSYAIYMFDQAVMCLFHRAFSQGSPTIRTPRDVCLTVLASRVTLLLAMFSDHFFERPILRFGHRFQYSPNPSESIPLKAVSNAI